MKSGVTLQQMLTEVKRQSESKEDYLIAPNRLRMESYGKEMFLHLSDDSGTELIEPMTITGIAHRQIGTHLRIPAAYYDRMREERPDLLAYNANIWFKQESSQRMLRTLDGSARAYLSNRYRRIDNIDIAGVTLPIAPCAGTVQRCGLVDFRRNAVHSRDVHDHVVTGSLPQQRERDAPKRSLAVAQPGTLQALQPDSTENLIDDAHIRVEHKTPYNTYNGQRNDVREIENRAIQDHFFQLALVQNECQHQTTENCDNGNNRHQLCCVYKCLNERFVVEHIDIVIQCHKFVVKPQRGRIGKRKI